MFRVWPSIVSKEADGDTRARARTESDVILTALVLGFTESRLVVGDDLIYSFEPPKAGAGRSDEEDRVARAVDAVNAALRTFHSADEDPAVFPASARARAEPAPDWELGAVITGAVGSATSTSRQRLLADSRLGREALWIVDPRLADADQPGSDEKEPFGYQGPGAYTGLAFNPFGSPAAMSTRRANVPDSEGEKRWRPPAFDYGHGYDQTTAAWGLLLDDKGKPWDTMYAEPMQPGGIVGYAHGMIEAIYSCLAEGPWCTPFEVAVAGTRKMASCFLCSTYMYAAGYPPSAIHLGRSDSWLPFYPAPQPVPNSHQNDAAVTSANLRWFLECGQHVRRGLRVLYSLNLSSDAVSRALRDIDHLLGSRVGEIDAAANLVLDAVTVPGSICDRIPSVLPALTA